MTELSRDLERALNVTLGGEKDGKASERTLFFLIDATTSLRDAGFADKFARALRANARHLKGARIGVGRIGAKRLVLLKPTDDHRLVPEVVRQCLEKPSTEFRNVYAAVRKASTAVRGRAGTRELILVSLENGDAIDDLEKTAVILKRAKVRFSAITRESYLSDSFWVNRKEYWDGGVVRRPPDKCEVFGADSAFVDMPWGWLFQLTVANEVVPSGYAVYGISRLAGATGGRVFLYAPPSTSDHQCAVYGTCHFCTGEHLPHGEDYRNTRMRALAPSIAARKHALRKMAEDPYYKSVLVAWRDAAKAGLIATTPAVRRVGRTLEPTRVRGGKELGLTDSARFTAEAGRAEKAARECSRILARLEKAMAGVAQPAPSRGKAIADLTRFYLHLSRVNLTLLGGWCREIAPGQLKGPPLEAPEVPAFTVGKNERPDSISYNNLCLCHGVKPFLALELPGGERTKKDLRALDEVYQKLMAEYAHTPIAVAMHRAGIAHYTICCCTTGSQPRARRTSRSKQETGPLTDKRGRPARAGGATTGGRTSGGPTTGK